MGTVTTTEKPTKAVGVANAAVPAGRIGLATASALYVAAVLGAGVLVLPGLAADAAGPASVLAVAVVLLLSIPLAGTFAALAARYPDAGLLADRFGQRGVLAERGVDRLRVGVQVQQAPAARHRRGEVAQVTEGEGGLDVAGSRAQPHCGRAVRQPQPAGVPVGTLAIGKAGAINAALLAAAILATGDPDLGARLERWREEQTGAVAEAPE